MKIKIDDEEFSVDISPIDGGYLVDTGSRTINTLMFPPLIKANGKKHIVHMKKNRDNSYDICVDEENFSVRLKDLSSNFLTLIKAPMQGSIMSVEVKKGQEVKKGETILRIMSMKMENEIKAEQDCVIKAINVKRRQTVSKGDLLIELDETAGHS